MIIVVIGIIEVQSAQVLVIRAAGATGRRAAQLGMLLLLLLLGWAGRSQEHLAGLQGQLHQAIGGTGIGEKDLLHPDA